MKRLKTLLCAALLALAAVPAHAEVDLVGDDTDLFTRNPNIASQIPNVLLILDNTSNWSNQSQHWPGTIDATCNAVGITGNQQGDSEVCAIYKALGSADAQVNVGLMMFNDQDKGSYVRFGMKPMSTTNKASFRTILKDIRTNDPEDKAGSNSVWDKVMNDAFRYFNSFATFGGTGAAAPVADNTAYTSTAKTAYQFLANANDTSCGFDYIIFIGNGISNKSEGFTTLDAAAALLNDPSVKPNKSILNNTGRNTDVWARFLFQYGVKVADGVYRHVTTYTIDVCKDQCDPDNAIVMQSMANISQGKYQKATSLEEIEAALKIVFSEVQAVNSVFAATTLPVSINVRGTNLNQVYIGVFRPDPLLSPRWIGNLKHYKLGVANADTGQLELRDANDVPAVNLNTGFISNTATSIWTEKNNPISLPGFWSFRAPYPTTDVGQDEDGPDGDLVEKGGAAQMIRKQFDFPDSTVAKSRKIYTCTTSTTAGRVCSSGDLLSDNPFIDDGVQGNLSGITPAALKTFAGTPLVSLTGNASTATATTASPHTFLAGQTVVITGATPALYNGSFTILTVGTNTFTYSIAPAVVDQNNAFATFPGYPLVTGTDFVVVTGATPINYNTPASTANPFNGVSVAAVAGNPNQFSYPLTIPGPTTAAAGYQVTGVRRISSLTWANDTANATAILPNHGYADGDTVKITGASPAEFNFPAGVTVHPVDANQFTYQIPLVTGGTPTTANATAVHSFSAGDLIVITGSNPAAYDTVATGSTITNVTGTGFRYTTSAGVLSPAITPGTARRRVAADVDTYTVTTVANGTSSNRDKLIITISGGLAGGTPLVAGQEVHTLAPGDRIAVQGITCISSVTAPPACSTVTSPPGPGTAGSAPYTITIESVNAAAGTITIDTNRNDPLSSFASAKVYWTGETFSTPPVTLTAAVPGPITVTATGAPYAAKTADLTSKVTSIASQGVATGNILAASATSSDPAEYANLIKWVRGMDNRNQENLNGMTTDIRAMVHGDVLHSRPSVVNYNRFGDENDVYIYYGANDGMLRSIKGGTLSDGGHEQWAFIPEEFFGKLKRLRDQTPVISSTSPRDYFFDGPMATYTLDSSEFGAPNNRLQPGDGDKVHLFIGMRRGGRMLYALDVTDPLVPKLLWRKGCREATGNGTAVGAGACDFGFGELGFTWSEPKLGYLKAFQDRLVVMFAAGYEPTVEDFQPCVVSGWSATAVQAKINVAFPNVMNEANCPPTTGTSTSRQRTMGRGIFILDAADGSLLFRIGPDVFANRQVADMTFAMPGDLAVLRNRANTASRTTSPGFENVPLGYLDRIYATDTGGHIWRLDVSDDNVANWVITKFASVAEAPAPSQHAARNYRKFMFNPDVVYTNETNGTPYDAVLIGSGDREHPFDIIVRNRFYMFKDKKVTSYTRADVPLANEPTPPDGTIVDSQSSTHLTDVTDNCLQICTGTQLSAAQSALAASRGWKLRFEGHPGEKTVSAATTAAGTVIFNTNEPKDDGTTGQTTICTSALGTARQYGINFQNATSTNIFNNLPAQYVPAGGRFALFAGGGFLPQPVPVVVKIGNKYYQTVVAGVQTTNPGGLRLQTRLRTYWYRQIE